jgi:hypothetical protein
MPLGERSDKPVISMVFAVLSAATRCFSLLEKLVCQLGERQCQVSVWFPQ